MAFPVYSTAFIVEQGLTGSISFAVPPNYIAVVRCIDVYGSVLFNDIDVYFYRQVQQATFAWFHYLLDDQGVKSWRGRQVVYSEDEIVADNIGAHPVDVSVSGYLLSTAGL